MLIISNKIHFILCAGTDMSFYNTVTQLNDDENQNGKKSVFE